MSENLIHFIDQHGGKRLEPATTSQIEVAENKIGMKLPDTLKEFYFRCGGTDTFTDSMWRFWPIEELVPLSTKVAATFETFWSSDRQSPFDPKDYIAFADAMIELPVYAICADQNSPHYGEVISEGGGDTIGGPIQSLNDFANILAKHWEFSLLPDTLEE